MKAWVLPADGSPKGSVLFVHGWSSDGGRMAPLAAPLAARGLATVLVDLPGHGRTGPIDMYNGKLMLDDVARVAAWMEAERAMVPRPWAILGYSFGGLGAYVTATRDPRWSAAVLAAVPVGPMEATALYLDGLGLPGRWLVRRLRPALERIVGVDPDAFAGPRVLPAIEVPVLIIHGEDDRVVPVAHAEALAAAAPAGLATLVRCPGLDHNTLMVDAGAAERIADFLAGRLRSRA